MLDVALEGLRVAASKFDPTRGRCSTCVRQWVREAIARARHDLGSAMHVPLHEAKDAIRAAKGEFIGRDYVKAGGAQRQADRVRSAWLALKCYAVDAPGEDGITLSETLAARDEADGIEAAERSADLATALALLPDRLRLVIDGCYPTDGREPTRVPDLATALGMSRARLYQLRRRGLARLRADLIRRPSFAS